MVQARLGSSRLPGKILMPAAGRPLLECMLERVAAARSLDEIVVATTRQPADEVIVRHCDRLSVACVEGDETDLIARHLLAARAARADIVVKIPSDCPLIDPAAIDEVVGFFRTQHPRYGFVSNLHPPTWPDGNDVEVMSLDVLEAAAREARLPFQREHTTPFIWDHPERFSQRNVAWSSGRDLSATHRLTLDYAEDYLLISQVYEALYQPQDPIFSVEEIVDYLDARPEVRDLNAKHRGSAWMQRHTNELRTKKWRPGIVSRTQSLEDA